MLNLDNEIRINGTHELSYAEVRKVVGKYKNVYVDGYFSIGECAFVGTSVQTLRIGKSIIGIKEKAFKGVKSLTNLIFDEGSNLKTIGSQSFYSTSLEDVTFPVSTTVLFDETFSHCKSLRTITLSGNNLSYIGYNVFKESSLTSFTASKNQLNSLNLSVRTNKIGGKENITVYSLDSSEEVITLLTNNLLNSVDTTHTINGTEELTQTIVQNNIGDGSGAVDVIITGFTSIGNNAFSASGLSGSITLPASLTSIESSAFSGCSNLTSVSFESNSQLETIGTIAFSNTGLSGSITLPASLKSIGSSAFNSCRDLTSVNLHELNHLETIGGYAFFWSGLSGSITIPASVRIIGYGPFDDCSSLTSVTFEIDSKLETIDETKRIFHDSGVTTFTAPKSVLDLFDVSTGTNKIVGGQPSVTVIIIINGTGELTQSIVQDHIGDGSGAVDVIITGFSSIGDNAFYQLGLSGSITLPASLTSIGINAFYYCSKLTSVIFEPNSQLTSIRDHAFSGCSKLTSVNFNELNQLDTIGERAFRYSALSGSITLPASLKSIGYYAFRYSSSLTSVSFESGSQLVTIGASAFAQSGLSGSITLPASLKSIENGAFQSCSSLTSVNFEPNSRLVTINNYAFEHSGLSGSITLPASLTSIGEGAFYGCSTLTYVNFNLLNQLTEIGISAFSLSGLSGDITLPASLTYLGNTVFYECSSSFSVSFESGSQLVTIGASAFAQSGLTSISLPESLSSIENGAFQSCSSLTSVNFEPNSRLVTINNYAFEHSGLSGSITLPASLTSIGEGAFSGCSTLTYVNFNLLNKLNTIGISAFSLSGLSGDITLPASLTYLGNTVFYECSSSFSVSFESGIQLETIGASAFYRSGLSGSITLPASLKSIGEYAFSECSNSFTVSFESNSQLVTIGNNAFYNTGLTGSITLPASLKGIGEYAFCDLGLISVDFESGSQLTTIDGNAFKNSGISGIIILPASLKSIGSNAFRSCTSLTSVIIELNSQLTTMGDYAFYESGLTTFTAPQSVLDLFWVQPGENKTVGRKAGVTVTVVTIIDGTGELTQTIVQYHIGDGSNAIDIFITGFSSIGYQAFFWSGLSGNIFLPASLTSIGDQAFYQCSSLNFVNFHDLIQLETIGSNTFRQSGLSGSITLHSSLKSIGESAFYRCPHLTSVNFEDTQLDLIDHYAFYWSGLKGSITLPVSLKTIGQQAFRLCYQLTSVIFEPNSQLETIGDYSFYESGLTTFTAPQSVLDLFGVQPGENKTVGRKAGVRVYTNIITGSNELTPTIVQENIGDGSSVVDVIITGFTSIGSDAFKNSSLSGSITLPASLTSIGDNAFQYCFSLTSVSFDLNSQLETISDNIFQETTLSTFTAPQSVLDLFGVSPGTNKTVGGKAGVRVYTNIITGSNELTPTIVQNNIGDGSIAIDVIITGFSTIGDNAFQNSNLRSITLPASVTSIGDNAFQYCSSLTSVNFYQLNQLTTIGGSAFKSSSLSGSITLPASLQYLEEGAFQSCSNLTSVSFEPNSQLETIGETTFHDSGVTIFTAPKSVLDLFDVSPGTNKTVGGQPGVTVIIIINGTDELTQSIVQDHIGDGSGAVDVIITGFTSISGGAFSNSGISGSITLPASLTSIRDNAFQDCSSLTYVIFEPNSQLVRINTRAFYRAGLSTITLPASLQYLEVAAFERCSSLTTVNFENGCQLDSLGSNVFASTGLTTFTAPPLVLTSFGVEVGENKTVNGNDNVRVYTNVITGSNELTSEIVVQHIGDGSSAVDVIITGYSTIGNSAFYKSGLSGSITIPSSLTSIGDLALNQCSSLTSVIFEPNSQLETIGMVAFYNSGLTGEISLPSSLKTIKARAFRDCFKLTSMRFENGSELNEFGDNAIQGTSISALYAPLFVLNLLGVQAGVNRTVGGIAGVSVGFATTTHLINGTNELTADKVLQIIGDGSDAVDVMITGFTSIGSDAFKNSSLSGSITLPASLTSIGDGAFYGCSSLTSVIFDQNSQLTTIGDDIFQESTLSTFTAPQSVLDLFGVEVGENKTVGGKAGVSVGFARTTHFISGTGELTPETVENNIGGGSTAIDVIITGYSSIGDNAFKQSGLSGSIALPASLTRIGENAFSLCSSLTSVIFESNSQLETIGDYAFEQSGLSGSITLPATLTSIGSHAFYYILSDISVNFNEITQLTEIGRSAFYQSSLIGSVSFPSSLETIGNLAFGFCPLTSVTFQSNSALTTLGGTNIFNEAEDLLFFYAPPSVLTLFDVDSFGLNIKVGGSKVGMTVLYSDSNTHIISGSGTEALTRAIVEENIGDGSSAVDVFITGFISISDEAFYQLSLSGTLYIPSSVTRIGIRAFQQCFNLTSVIFEPNSQLETIDNYAFYQSGLSGSITLPASLTSIRQAVFYECSLTSVIFEPNSQLTTITKYAFDKCDNLEYVNLSSLPTMGVNAFVSSVSFTINVPAYQTSIVEGDTYYLSQWTSVSFEPNSQLETIGNNAFKNSSLSGSITLPASVTIIGQSAFYGCTSLTSVSFEQDSQLMTMADGAFEGSGVSGSITLPASLKTIGTNAFHTTLNPFQLTFEPNSQLETIGSFAFFNTYPDTYKGLSGSITLPASLTNIEESAFRQCFNLTSVEFEANSQLDTIGNNAFNWMGLNGSITLPTSVTKIGDIAFYKCSTMTSVNFHELNQLETIGNSAFQQSDVSGNITLPASLTSIGTQAFHSCSNLTLVNLSSLPTIGVNAFGYSVSFTINVPASQTSIVESDTFYLSQLTSLSFEPNSQLGTIGNNAFENSSLSGSITLPASLTSIGESAFYQCPGTFSVSFEPNSQLVTIGNNAFLESGLSGSITLPASLTSIGESAFRDCSNLTSVIFEPNSQLGSILRNAFRDSSLSGSITLPSSVTSIGGYAFSSCSTLTYVNFDLLNQLTEIGSSAFQGSGLSGDITLPASLTYLGNTVFYECSSSFSVSFESGIQLETIGTGTFFKSGLSGSITLPASLESIGGYAFSECSNLISVSFELNSKITTVGSGIFESTSLSSFSAPQSVLDLFGVEVGENKTVGGTDNVYVSLSGFTIQMTTGMNLIGMPFRGSIKGDNITSVYKHDPDELTYQEIEKTNDEDGDHYDLLENKGYWVKTNNANSVLISDNTYQTNSIQLTTGMNLIGMPVQGSIKGDNITAVYEYNTNKHSYNEIVKTSGDDGDHYILQVKEGYWVITNNNTSIDIITL